MSRIKVNIDKPLPTPEEVRKHKDFNRFMDNYKKYYTPRGFRYLMRKEKKKFIFIILMIVVLLLLIFGESEAKASSLTWIKSSSSLNF